MRSLNALPKPSTRQVLDVSDRECLGEADEEATEHRARDRPDPADDRGGEPLQAVVEAHEVVDRAEHEPDEDARGAGQCGADEERLHDDAVDVDAHHRGRFAVERSRTHRLPELRAGDEQPERGHHRRTPRR